MGTSEEKMIAVAGVDVSTIPDVVLNFDEDSGESSGAQEAADKFNNKKNGKLIPGSKAHREKFPEKYGVYKSIRTTEKTGRNEPCACGSGKKYKKCCGARLFAGAK